MHFQFFVAYVHQAFRGFFIKCSSHKPGFVLVAIRQSRIFNLRPWFLPLFKSNQCPSDIPGFLPVSIRQSGIFTSVHQTIRDFYQCPSDIPGFLPVSITHQTILNFYMCSRGIANFTTVHYWNSSLFTTKSIKHTTLYQCQSDLTSSYTIHLQTFYKSHFLQSIPFFIINN